MESEEKIPVDQGPRSDAPPLSGILSLLVYLYFMIAFFIAVPYFNYQYARQHGFINWLFLGEVAPTAQSLIWPYYLLTSKPSLSWTEAEKANLRHFHNSDNAARGIIQLSKFSNGTNLSPAEISEYLSLSRSALREAKLVNPKVLAKAHPDLPYHYQNEYIASFEIYHRAIEGNMDISAQLKSRKLWDDWVDWFNDNKSDIRLPKK